MPSPACENVNLVTRVPYKDLKRWHDDFSHWPRKLSLSKRNVTPPFPVKRCVFYETRWWSGFYMPVGGFGVVESHQDTSLERKNPWVLLVLQEKFHRCLKSSSGGTKFLQEKKGWFLLPHFPGSFRSKTYLDMAWPGTQVKWRFRMICMILFGCCEQVKRFDWKDLDVNIFFCKKKPDSGLTCRICSYPKKTSHFSQRISIFIGEKKGHHLP